MDKKTEEGYERAQDSEMEARQLLADAQRDAIDSRIDVLWRDKAMVCQAIEECLHEISLAEEFGSDVAGDIEKIIEDHFRVDVIDELNL